MQDEEESIMVSDWPVFKEELDFKAEENEVEIIKMQSAISVTCGPI